MQPEGSGHSEDGTDDGIGHVWAVDVVEVVASKERQGMDGFDVAAPKRAEMDVFYGLVVVLDVAQVVRWRGHDAARGKDHVDEGEPGGIASPALVVMFTKRGLVQHGSKDVNTFEVGIDKSLPFVRPRDGRLPLGGLGNCAEERNAAACIFVARGIGGRL